MKIDGDNYYYFWYDTYPMEFAVFLLDSALARGVYYHTMSANDAFYERSHGENDGAYYQQQQQQQQQQQHQQQQQ